MLVASSNFAMETGPIEIFLMLETINAGDLQNSNCRMRQSN